LSIKNYVLPDPAIAPLAKRVVFAAVDSDRPANADFLARHTVEVWPTLFVLDPRTDAVLGYWQGSASVGELRQFITDAVDARDAAFEPNGPVAALLAAKRAHARGDHASAARDYEQAVNRGGLAWSRRSEALAGLLMSKYRQHQWQSCTRLGSEHVATIQGAAVPADFCYLLLACATKLPKGELKRNAVQRVVKRLRAHTETPPPAASVDDRSDALAILSRALRSLGDADGARRATEKQLALLEQAAATAPSAGHAATFDYARMNAYLALGRGERAVAMLIERVRQLPDGYEPRARLAQTLIALKRWSEALDAIDGAIARAYGSRQLRYLRMRVDILGKLGRQPAQRKALQALIAAYEALPSSQRDKRRNQQLVKAAREQLARLATR